MTTFSYTTTRSKGSGRKAVSRRPRATVEALTREADQRLSIRDRAAQLGGIEQPPVSATDPCAVEIDIQGLHEDHVTAAFDAAMGDLADLGEIAARLSIDADEHSFEPHIKKLRGELRANEPTAKAAMRPLVAEAVTAGQQVAVFSAQHDLPQELPFRGSLVFWLAMILLAPVVEAFTSAGIFGEGDALGGLGGLLTAALLGLANATAGVGLAYGRANWGHRRSAMRKVLGAILILGSAGAALLVNLFATHWRLAMTVAPSSPFEFVRQSLAQDPFGPLMDMKAAALVLVSAFFIGLVAWETVQTWSTYVGYRDYAVRRLTAMRRLQRTRRELMRFNVRQGRRAKEAIETQADIVADKAAMAKDVVADAMLAVSGYNGEIEAIRVANERSHSLFRDVNSRVRMPRAAPAYFKSKPVLDAPSLTVSQAFSQKADHMAILAQNLLQDLGDAFEAIDDVIEAAQSRILALEAEVEAEVKGGMAHLIPPAPRPERRFRSALLARGGAQ